MKYHQILKQKYNKWSELEKVIESLPTTTERGDVFEQFIYCYFNINKELYQLKEIYRERDIPAVYREKYKLEKRDTGVDGIFILENGKCAGYQVKFRVGREIPSYAELSKFWVEAKLTDYHYTVANCYYLTKLSQKNEKHLSVLVDELDNLNQVFFVKLFEFVNSNKVVNIKYSPDDSQKKMIKDCVNGFKEHDRGKLIAACGTGKTLAALWITEAINTKTVLFLAPSLALIKQTLESWSDNASESFSFLCVCSDSTVSNDVDDAWDISIEDLSVPVTTSAEAISNYLYSLYSEDHRKKIVFSTYQSLDVLEEGLKANPNFKFDMIVFDEAHRTAGAKNSKLFSLALNDENIKGEKRLFMTATERLVRPWIIKKAEEYDRILFSMDNEEVYGPTFHRFNFGSAIEKGIIADYRIIIAGVKQSELAELIKSNKWLVESASNSEERFTSGQNIFRQVLLLKAMQEFPIYRTITFHSDIKKAKEFISGLGRDEISLDTVFKNLWPSFDFGNAYFDHINGTMNAGERKEKLDRLQKSKYGIISNARCLTEGVDVPVIDSVYFVNPKSSLIDIVQACGRALRKPRTRDKVSNNNIINTLLKTFGTSSEPQSKIAYFIIPVLIPDGSNNTSIVNEIDFEMLYNLIQSLREQDQRLSEWIDKLNLEATKGKISNFSKVTDSPIIFKLPKEFNIGEFKNNLYLKIAEVNSNPTTHGYRTIKYGRKERKSNYKRIFKTLGDYSFDSYKLNLVDPTITKLKLGKNEYTTSEIAINNNNVSHTERLGLLIKKDGKYSLSPLGVQYSENKVIFEDLFKRQMLKYFSIEIEENKSRVLFPYRTCLKLLLNLKSINYVEFVFCLYPMIDSTAESLIEANEGVQYIRKYYPNIEITNEINKANILGELNAYFGTNYSLTDVWAKKTTVNNQFIYFRNHLSLFNDVIEVDSNSIRLKTGKEGELKSLLSQDESLEKEEDSIKLQSAYYSSLLIIAVFNLLK